MYGTGRDSYNPYYGPGRYHPHDYPSWGYIILYLVVILGSLIGNGLFLLVIQKNKNLHRSVHFLLGTLAARDIIVTLLVVPFVIDMSVKLMEWRSGGTLCKLFSFLDMSTMAVHAFLLVFLLLFLYFWYRKQEAYMTEEGQTVVRKNRLHKWVIPLVWVLGLGLAIPAGALAYDSTNPATGIRTCSIWDGRGMGQSNFWVQLSGVILGFFLPAVLFIFPCIALTMQVCGSREPRLDPPHDRTAWTALALILVFLATRAPAEIYMLMKLFQQSDLGFRTGGSRAGTPYYMMAFETQMILNAIVYVACLIHPILYFALNPIYRSGLGVVWSDLYCNQDPAQRQREEEMKKQRRLHQRQYPARGSNNRAPAGQRAHAQPLLNQRQPQIMGSMQGMQYQPYPQPSQVLMHHQTYPGGVPQQLVADQQFLDNSFERLTPQLPPVFEYNGLKYIDTARVEPRIGYSPEKTPPRTPDTPRYREKPFVEPGWSPPPAGAHVEMVDLSPQIMAHVAQAQAQGQGYHPRAQSPPQGPLATSEPKREDFQIENMERSPGNTLRTRRNKDALDETVQELAESPGQKHRRKTQESQQTSGYNSSNGTGVGVSSSRPTSPLDRPNSRVSGVEITLTGRTRSRTDLCPDVPRSKFEHSV